MRTPLLLLLLAGVLLAPAAIAQTEPDEPRGVLVTGAAASGGAVLVGVVGMGVGVYVGATRSGARSTNGTVGGAFIGGLAGVAIGSAVGAGTGAALGAGEPLPRALLGAAVGELGVLALGTGLAVIGVEEGARWVLLLAPVGGVVGAIVATR